jgi:prepilin-type N-terminal cleavage/methylation domain-containing protein
VRALTARERLLREERGFTLSEMMVTIVIWSVVLFALYSLFDMSVRISGVGNNKVEAMESARVGLEKMEREIRGAYAVDRAINNTQLFQIWTPTQIRFGNDLNGNRRVDAATEQITYVVDGTTLERNGLPAVESVQNLTFVYLDANRNPVASGIEGDIAMVRIVLEIAEASGTDFEGTQKLTTDIDLRNR